MDHVHYQGYLPETDTDIIFNVYRENDMWRAILKRDRMTFDYGLFANKQDALAAYTIEENSWN